MEAACYDANKQQSFEQQCTAWHNMDLSQLSTYPQIIACELFHFDACMGIYGGPFCSDYDRFKVLKGALEQHHSAAAEELEDIIVEGIDTDTLSMAWGDISGIIRKAFTRATRRGPIRPSPLKKGLEPLQTFHARKQTDETEDQDRLDVRNYMDKTIPCIRQLPTGTICDKKFVHSAVDQVEYIRLGFPNDPKGCPDCRRRIRQEQGTTRGGLCNEFTRTGKCSRADKCAYSHTEPPAEPAQSNEMVPYKPSVNFTAVEMDSDGSDDIDPDCY
jgi:hypothetical protein